MKFPKCIVFGLYSTTVAIILSCKSLHIRLWNSRRLYVRISVPLILVSTNNVLYFKRLLKINEDISIIVFQKIRDNKKITKT